MQPTFTDLRGRRVRITYHDGEVVYGIFQSVTPEKVWLSGQTWIHRPEVSSIEPAPLYCARCEEETTHLFDGLCAADYRTEARTKPRHQEVCARPDCSEPGILDPSSPTSEFLCVTHHAMAGHTLKISGGATAVIATCATEDVSSPKHEWKHVRGTRFRCSRCSTAEKFDANLLREMEKAFRD